MSRRFFERALTRWIRGGGLPTVEDGLVRLAVKGEDQHSEKMESCGSVDVLPVMDGEDDPASMADELAEAMIDIIEPDVFRIRVVAYPAKGTKALVRKTFYDKTHHMKVQAGEDPGDAPTHRDRVENGNAVMARAVAAQSNALVLMLGESREVISDMAEHQAAVLQMVGQLTQANAGLMVTVGSLEADRLRAEAGYRSAEDRILDMVEENPELVIQLIGRLLPGSGPRQAGPAPEPPKADPDQADNRLAAIAWLSSIPAGKRKATLMGDPDIVRLLAEDMKANNT